MMTNYIEELTKQYEDIADKVRRDMLPLVARNPAIERVVDDYVDAQANHFATLQDTPIKFGPDYAIERFADLIIHEELTWSHPDKMSIVEYPVMSDTQEDDRSKRFLPIPELEYGDLRFRGKRKVATENRLGGFNVKSRRVFDITDDGLNSVVTGLDVHNALGNVKMTTRQREAIDLVFFEKMTQEEAAEVMGVRQNTVNEHLEIALKKLRKFMS